MNFDGYKKRNYQWNYGGRNWKLSRSKIDLFTECPRCFYLDNKLGIRRPGFPPFNLNSAVDELLKKEFDVYRRDKKPHPLMEEHNIDAIPFDHPSMDTWRENFEGIQFVHKPTGMTISGAIDDVWVKPNGELLVVDYKSTSKEEQVSLDDRWKDGYKRQMEVYQWLLRQIDFDVSDKGYFVYANAMKKEDSFDGKLIFDMQVLDYEGVTDWVEPTILKIKEVLDGDEIPESGQYCEHCPYHNTRSEEKA